MMDLGATICTARAAEMPGVPAARRVRRRAGRCRAARRDGRATHAPRKPPQSAHPVRAHDALPARPHRRPLARRAAGQSLALDELQRDLAAIVPADRLHEIPVIVDSAARAKASVEPCERGGRSSALGVPHRRLARNRTPACEAFVEDGPLEHLACRRSSAATRIEARFVRVASSGRPRRHRRRRASRPGDRARERRLGSPGPSRPDAEYASTRASERRRSSRRRLRSAAPRISRRNASSRCRASPRETSPVDRSLETRQCRKAAFTGSPVPGRRTSIRRDARSASSVDGLRRCSGVTSGSRHASSATARASENRATRRWGLHHRQPSRSEDAGRSCGPRALTINHAGRSA